MPKFCVAFISKFDNNLEQYIVEATDWREALDKAKPGYIENITHCKTMEEAGYVFEKKEHVWIITAPVQNVAMVPKDVEQEIEKLTLAFQSMISQLKKEKK